MRHFVASRPSQQGEPLSTQRPCRPDDALTQMAAAAHAADPLPELDDLPPVPKKVRELVLDRIDAAYRAGLIALSCEAYSGLLIALFPDEFDVPACPPPATGTPPKTRERERVYARRVRAAVDLFHSGDASGDQAAQGLAVAWPIGRTPKVKGWRAETPRARRRK